MSKRTKEQVALDLARSHAEVEPWIIKIVRVRSPDAREKDESEPVKLLEVNPATPSNGIIPIFFGPNPAAEIDFPSVIVEVTPEEYHRVESGSLALPDGWRLGETLLEHTSAPTGE